MFCKRTLKIAVTSSVDLALSSILRVLNAQPGLHDGSDVLKTESLGAGVRIHRSLGGADWSGDSTIPACSTYYLNLLQQGIPGCSSLSFKEPEQFSPQESINNRIITYCSVYSPLGDVCLHLVGRLSSV